MIIHILEGAKGVGKSTYALELKEELERIDSDQLVRWQQVLEKRGINVDVTLPIKFIHLDKDTPNTIEYFKELHDDQTTNYILDRGWLSELVYTIVYNRDEKFTMQEVARAGLLDIPHTLFLVAENDIDILYDRIQSRDNHDLDTLYKRQVRHSNRLFSLYSLVLLETLAPSQLEIKQVKC